MPRKLLVGGASRCGSLKGVKKVSPPTVPALPLPTANQVKRHSTSNPCVCNGDQLGDLTSEFEHTVDINFNHVSSRRQYRTSSVGNSYSHVSFNLEEHCRDQVPSMKKVTSGCGAGSNGQIHLAHVIVHSQPESLPITPTEPSHSPNLMKGRLMSGTQTSLEDQGIDVSSPGRHSPGGSSGGSSVSRHSLSSLDSGRASAPGSENKVINRRLSVHSYESTGSPQRRSYHSSSSSLASSGEDPHGTVATNANVTISVLGQGPNVAEMVLHGLPDIEVLSNWLASLRFEEYISLFLQAGYDMPTITRMTPEDLTAIGITKPNHRRKMKSEITKLNISDGIPEYKPDTLLEWLQLLRLEDYYSTLCQQHYDTIDRVTELTWEDLEDIGIQKLGHQKKILLAIKRIEDINQGRRPNLIPTTKKQYTEYQSNSSSNYARPSTLNSIQPFVYPAQEVAIAMQRPKNSPSTDSIPEMKTFQQSPIREENLLLENIENCSFTATSSAMPHPPQPATNTVSSHQNGNSNYALSPCRGRSLESLHSDENGPVVATTTSLQPALSYPAAAPVLPADRHKLQLTKDWKTTDLDTEQNFECDGTATLNRPKGMMKLRPIAKISAKTREEMTEVMLDIPDHEFKSMLNNAKILDGWSSLDGSPRHGPSTVPRGSTMRRPPPPPPPKRTNSTKGEKSAVEAKKDEPPPIKQRPPHLAPPCQRSSSQNPPKHQDINSCSAEDFPPPPSPLHLSTSEDKSKAGAESETRDELFNNPLFQQKRKDSASSTDASALPFANEAMGTIKQKSARPNLSLSAENTLKNSGCRKELNDSGNPFLSQKHEYDRTSEAMSPGDVIDDIEHMLANLSDQLDAMLDDEQIQK